MALPIVAVVGRPNVGKSTLVNRLAQASDAIVHEARGVTRDRSYHRSDWNGRDFMLIDTGGIESAKDDPFSESITAQAMVAAEEADVVIVLVDGKTGVMSADEEVARKLRRAKKPIFLVVNKMDTPNDETAAHEFWALGIGEPWAVSATHGHGTGDLLDAVVAALPETEPHTESDAIDVAIIGRPNAGKSSLLNRLARAERAIVSDVAGTTRDALDVLVETDGRAYRFVDTAGLRRKSLIDEDVEYYGFVRAMRAIDRADVALLMVD
ncbi:MAG: ribosome biogenesis GTPase Der, partial [Coriobacteriia bacterium]|nr:ribosome biogenesis GTPase Der [Coriobacteriia bacterium]